MNPHRPVWILTTPRTGSTLLAGYITRALREAGIEGWRGITGDPHLMTERYITAPGWEWLRAKPGDIPPWNKVFPDQYERWHGDYTLDRVGVRWQGVRYIRLLRQDPVAQALSYRLSLENKVWNTHSPARLAEYARKAAKPNYAQVLGDHLYLRRLDRVWHDALAPRPHLTLTYEMLTETPPAEWLPGVLAWCGLPVPDPLPEPPTRKLAAPEKELWTKQARAYMRERGCSV